MKPQYKFLSFAVAAALSPLAMADGAMQAVDLDEVIVTGTRTEVALVDSLVPAQVVDRAEIERSQARDLIELLRGRAGIDIGNNGGRGKISSLFLRGAESDHLLVLVDGVKIGSATSGAGGSWPVGAAGVVPGVVAGGC